ncbi:MAG: 4'-phosphopantetheinyl transferase superfamily protein [Pirellulales bacterium]|nr:4'-phosphopantetheinyl transferase superfamily protein [Pirellulales bacterium]
MSALGSKPPADLGVNEAHVWYVRTGEITDPDTLARYHRLLSPEEHARRERYRFEKDRHTHLVTRALVRTLLANYTGVDPAAWKFVTNAYGRPDVSEPECWRRLKCNVSHTTGLVAAIITWEVESGVDVEWRDRTSGGMDVADRFFSPDEVADLRKLPETSQRRGFFDYWTLKEAYIKARGMGLSLPLEQFSFVLRDAAPIGIRFAPELPDDPASWYFEKHYPTAVHTLSLAVRRVGAMQPRVLVRETVP